MFLSEEKMNTETSACDTRIYVPCDDTLEYKVFVSKAVPRGDATLTACVDVLVDSRNNGPEIIEQRVFEALDDFVSVPWESIGQERKTISPGYEQVSVQVLARISSEQNRNLEERARKASREGLEITEIRVKAALPQDQVNQIIKDLWFETVERINTHIADFNRVSGRQWRVGRIEYGVPSGNRVPVSSKGGYREEVDDLTGLSGAEKISLTAQVTLKSPRPDKSAG